MLARKVPASSCVFLWYNYLLTRKVSASSCCRKQTNKLWTRTYGYQLWTKPMDPLLWTRTHGSTFLDLTYGYICTYLESCKQLAIGYGQQLEYFKWSQHTIIGEKLICLIRFDLHLCVSSIIYLWLLYKIQSIFYEQWALFYCFTFIEKAIYSYADWYYYDLTMINLL